MRDLDVPSESAEESVLAAQFLAFHAELVALKRALSAQTDEDAAAQRQPAAIGHALAGFLQAQDTRAAGWGGRFGHENAQDARYLKAALADETLIGLQAWEHSAAWVGELLELRLFGTRCAGDRVFESIRTLLRERHPARREMGMLYLYALAMGFEGRYRGTTDGAHILAALREDLYAYASGDSRERLLLPGSTTATTYDAARERELARSVLPQPYACTIEAGAPTMLPDPRRWIWFFGGACALLFVLAGFVWRSQTGELASHFRTGAQASGSIQR